MSGINSKLDKITALLSPSEMAQCAVSAVTEALEEAMAGEVTIEAYRDKVIPEVERMISTSGCGTPSRSSSSGAFATSG